MKDQTKTQGKIEDIFTELNMSSFDPAQRVWVIVPENMKILKDKLKDQQNDLISRVIERVKNIKLNMDIDSYLPLVKEWNGGYDVPFDDGYRKAISDVLEELKKSL